jgi:hypothetical protein
LDGAHFVRAASFPRDDPIDQGDSSMHTIKLPEQIDHRRRFFLGLPP